MSYDAILRAIEGIDAGAGSAEKLAEDEFYRGLYPVPSQARTFDLDRIMIIGGRGTGKTQIFRALLSDKGREAVVRATGIRLIHDVSNMLFIEGFGAGRSFRSEEYPHPSADAIEQVLTPPDIRTARKLWLGLSLARLSIDNGAALLPESIRESVAPLRHFVKSPKELVHWVEEDVERPFSILDDVDRHFTSVKRACIFTFDALDRAANGWATLEAAVGGLLSLALDISRRSRSVRLKVFLRPDLESSGARSFPDASKLRGYREELKWDIEDLYRLAFKRMVVSPEEGAKALEFIVNAAGQDVFQDIELLGFTPTEAFDEAAQEKVMISLVGKYMGSNPRKGLTYTWIPNHLADASRRVSPRSFLVAFAEAARWTRRRSPSSQEHPLSPGALEEGVRAASQQRVQELAEDFPWVEEVGEHMDGLMVPCPESSVLDRLHRCKFPKVKRTSLKSTDPEMVLQQLMEMNVFQRDRDGRYNVPDLYRVAMQMKRRGGIKPAA